MSKIVITGANKGVGFELAKQYAAGGHEVFACCRDANRADDLKALKGNVTVMEVTVGVAESVAGFVASISDMPIDLLINNAGMSGPARDEQTFETMDFDGWAETFNVNTMAPVRVMQALLPNLRAAPAAKVVTITSQMGALALDMPVAYAYCTSKAAVNKFMKMAALELGKEGISVGLIHPGWVRTDMGGPHADLSAEESARGIVSVIEGLGPDTNGSFWKWNGEIHAW